MASIYADAHATTPCDPLVVEAMLPFFTERFGNAASQQHSYGWQAHEAVETARQHVANLVGAKLRDVVFTSGATEANNLALRGVVDASIHGDVSAASAGATGAMPGARPRTADLHIVTVVTEHPAVLDPVARLESEGVRVTRVPVQPSGLIDVGDVGRAITPGTTLVTVMTANNEIGVIQPIAAIATLAHAAGAFFHTDATQAAGLLPIDMAATGIDMLSLSAHKLYGPKGVGALVVRRASKVPLMAQQLGGGHERGLRSGTANVPGIVGFGQAARLARERRAGDAARVAPLRDRLWARLSEALDDVHLRGAMSPRLPNNLNVGIDGLTGRDLVLGLSGIALSPGAACASTSAAPSHVLMSLGLTEAEARSSLRFGLLRTVTETEVDEIAARVVATVAALRKQRAALP